MKLTHGDVVKQYYDSDLAMPCYHVHEFSQRISKIKVLFRKHITDTVLEIGAGKGFWTDSFIDKVHCYIAVELGERNCLYLQRKYSGYSDKVRIVNGDIFRSDLKDINVSTLLFSFFVSHFQLPTIISLLQRIRDSVNYSNIMLLDSYWSKYRRNIYEENLFIKQCRKLPEGTDVEIPKRYIENEDISHIATEMRMNYKIRYYDKYWLLAQIFNDDE